MPYGPDRPRGLLEQPGRLAAIGAAAVVCMLSVSGALGVSLTGSEANAAQHPSSEQLPRTLDASDADHNPARSGSTTGTPHRQTQADHRATDPAKNAAAPLAPLPADSGAGKRVVFGVAEQQVWLVDADGRVLRTYLVSGSKYDNLDLGTYHVTSRSRYATAYNSNETLNYMVRFAYGRTAPIGFHAIPVHPDGTLAEPRSGLGRPASDGCIRQWVTDARALWNFAPVGTTVVVHA